MSFIDIKPLVEFYYLRSKEWCDIYNRNITKDDSLSENAKELKKLIDTQELDYKIKNSLLNIFSKIIKEDISNFKLPKFSHVFLLFPDGTFGFKERIEDIFYTHISDGMYEPIIHMKPVSKDDIQMMIQGLKLEYASYIEKMIYISDECRKYLIDKIDVIK